MRHPKLTFTPRRLGELIALKRKEAGLTKGELAEALGIEPEAMSRVERGVTAASIERLNAVAHATGCALNELLLAAGNTEQGSAKEVELLLKGMSAKVHALILEMGSLMSQHMKGRAKGVSMN